MRLFHITLCASLAACSGSVAWAQNGLYGSPEMLRLPQQYAEQSSAATAAYPNTAAPIVQPVPAAQPAPASAYYPPQPQYRDPPQPQYRDPPQPQYRYPAQPQPQYRYPAQPAATAMYQPYQPGAQYRYPGPNTRPPVRTAAIDQSAMNQPTPAPPGVPAAPPPTASPLPNDNPAPQSSNVMNQMLAEPDGYGNNTDGCGSCGPYRGALGRFEQAACGPNSEGCGYDGCCGQRCCPWYASVSALVLGRSEGRSLWTSYQSTDEKAQGGNAQFEMRWQWGGEVQFGRRFCYCGVPFAVEATYWTTEAFTGFRSTSFAPDTTNTVLNVDNITFNVPGGATQDANIWFQGAGEQTLTRRDEFHNVEVNLIHEQLAWGCDSPWDIGWSVGVRYFRFQESLVFDSVMPGCSPGDIFDAYLSDNVTNNLVGAQFGFDAAYNLCGGVRVFISPKVGIYNNFIDSTFEAQLGNHVTNGQSTPYGTYYPIHGTGNAVSFLTQIDVGADWQFARNWSLRAGYRVVAVTGVGLAEDQFPQYICDVPSLQHVEHSSSLVLHGAFLGLTYNF